MSAPSTLICPTCGQRLPMASKRICGDCHKPIRRHEKYYFDGSTIKHRCCDDPTSYTRSTAEAI